MNMVTKNGLVNQVLSLLEEEIYYGFNLRIELREQVDLDPIFVENLEGWLLSVQNRRLRMKERCKKNPDVF